MKPKDVSKKNKGEVWTTLFGHVYYGELTLPKFKVGDIVGVSKYKSIFTKGYQGRWGLRLVK